MENLQILLRQHVGKPCAPVVKKGDKVRRGTLIAEPTGLGANIFSSADGVVEDVLEDRIIIKPDEEQSEDYEKIPEGTPLEMVKAAGVVGMGGAGFPTGIKLDTHFDGDGYILVNASECEPGLAHNIEQLDREPEKVIKGVKYAMEISGADKAIIAIKKKHHDTIVKLDELLADEPAISRHLLPDIYPMGEERAVVRAKMGILLCACGGNLERMRDLAKKYNAKEVSLCYCKQAQEQPNGSRKCERPGNCPGQVANNLQFKKDKCEYIIIGNCSDCSNTVMASGPKMGLKVLHMTDHVMRAVDHPLYRTLRVSKQVDQDLNVVDNVENN